MNKAVVTCINGCAIKGLIIVNKAVVTCINGCAISD